VWAYMNEDSSNMVPASERLIAFTESVSASKNKHLGGNRHHIVSVSMAHHWCTNCGRLVPRPVAPFLRLVIVGRRRRVGPIVHHEAPIARVNPVLPAIPATPPPINNIYWKKKNVVMAAYSSHTAVPTFRPVCPTCTDSMLACHV